MWMRDAALREKAARASATWTRPEYFPYRWGHSFLGPSSAQKFGDPRWWPPWYGSAAKFHASIWSGWHEQLGTDSRHLGTSRESRNGAWKIARRQGIYDFSYFNFPMGMVEIDRALVKKYPREYASLGYLLEKSGFFQSSAFFATKGSNLEKKNR